MKHQNDIQTGDLFDQSFFGTNPRRMARNTDPDTSLTAAESVDSARLERMVYGVICMYPMGCTSDQIMRHFPNQGVQTISPRYAPLIRKGLIVDTGERRKGSSGRSQRVMKATKANI